MKIVGEKGPRHPQREEYAHEKDAPPVRPVHRIRHNAHQPAGRFQRRHDNVKDGVVDHVLVDGIACLASSSGGRRLPIGHGHAHVQQAVQYGHEGGHHHDAGAVDGIQRGVHRQRGKEDGKARHQGFHLGRQIGRVKAGAVAGFLAPDGPKDGKVEQGAAVDGALLARRPLRRG